MKAIKILGLILATSSMAMAEKAFDVTLRVEDKGNEEKVLVLSAKTTKEHSSMCHLATTHYEVSKPMYLGRERMGRVVLELSTNPRAMCMHAFGPHRGSASFNMSEYAGAPALDGEYELTINAEKYGILTVKDGEATLVAND